MTQTMVRRIEVRPRPGVPDPRGDAVRAEAKALGLDAAPARVESASVYLVEASLDDGQAKRLAEALLADPVTEEATFGAQPPRGSALVEVHPLPGVMDPDAEALELAIRTVLGVDAQVRTGRRFDFHGTTPAQARLIAERSLANPVIQQVHDAPFHPAQFPTAQRHGETTVDVPIRDLDDAALERLSREGHLFLSLDEMRAIRDEYRRLGREPKDIELETLAQTWSEHCVHKTLKAQVRYHGELPNAAARPGHRVDPDGTIVVDNLLKRTVAAATHELIADGIDWCLSVFVDNAGVIAFDDQHAVCIKVETHNHPSAIEPYGGAATGIGGCIRDVMGTGLAAKPIAATDVFCVAHPDAFARPGADGAVPAGRKPLPAGCLHPARILRQVVAGVRDYGNRMGIPTLNGAVWFDDDHVGNPLVFCGCVGVMPRDRIDGAPRAGDRIVAIGGRTGRDGIHGATFSSAELTDTHADEFSHAVQIGNAVTEKKALDAILEARDWTGPDGERTCLFHAITDCGAGGFSSAVGEMGAELGATVDLDRAPLKYAGLSPTEIWISEAQERMVLAVPPENLAALAAICAKHDAEMCELGVFGTDGAELVLRFHGTEVGRLPMRFLHDGLPRTEREARWRPAAAAAASRAADDAPPAADALRRLLAHPNIASKHWIIRQYDHEVQGGTVVKPLVGPAQEGPGDAAVITPVLGSRRGLAIGNGLATGLASDPYLMVLAAIDECVRNLVCAGANPARIAILDNFCWPGVKDAESLGALVRAAAACYDGAKAYRTPFVSGKDSLNNQFVTDDGRTIRIPYTLLVSGIGIVEDLAHCTTMDAKAAGDLLAVVGVTTGAMGGSHHARLFGLGEGETALPRTDLRLGPRTAHAVHRAVQRGIVRAAHDPSEGGLLVAAAEMAMAGGLGVDLDTVMLPMDGEASTTAELFAETPGRYLLEVRRADLDRLDAALGDVPWGVIGEFTDSGRVRAVRHGVEVPLSDLRAAWRGTLDW